MVLTITISDLYVLAALDGRVLDRLLDAIVHGDSARGRPWSCSLRRRFLITCVALRTNLTLRELAVVVRISKNRPRIASSRP
jgi:hypothetical protein